MIEIPENEEPWFTADGREYMKDSLKRETMKKLEEIIKKNPPEKLAEEIMSVQPMVRYITHKLKAKYTTEFIREEKKK